MAAANLIILYVENCTKSTAFYRDLLEREPDVAAPNFSSFTLADGMSLGLWTRANAQPPAAAGGAEGEIAFMVTTPAEIEARLARAAANPRLRPGREPARYELVWAERPSHVFLTRDNALIESLSGAIEAVTGRQPKLSTTGGTSDARFIKDYCPVVEFGLVGQTMHMVDERVAVADLEGLTRIYETFIDRWFGHAVA